MAGGSYHDTYNCAIKEPTQKLGRSIMTLKNSPALIIRSHLLAISFLLMTLVFVPATARADGHLHYQPWLKQSSGDLRVDLAAAKDQGKHLALIWEQGGCVYCKKMHEVNFQYEEIVQIITEKFYPVQLDMRGDRKMMDFDGEELDESGLAHKHGVNGTPIIEFRDENAAEVFRLPGYAEPLVFHGVFDFVDAKAYTNSELIPWLRAKYEKQGDQPNDG